MIANQGFPTNSFWTEPCTVLLSIEMCLHAQAIYNIIRSSKIIVVYSLSRSDQTYYIGLKSTWVVLQSFCCSGWHAGHNFLPGGIPFIIPILYVLRK